MSSPKFTQDWNNVAAKERDLIWLPRLLFSNSIDDKQLEYDTFSTIVVTRVSYVLQLNY